MKTSPLSQRRLAILFLGIDGLSPFILNDLIQKNKLPHFKSLCEKGCYGELETIRPTNSAMIWTSIITGKEAKEHGIDSFIAYRWQNRLIRKTMMKKFMKIGGRGLIQRMIKNGSIKTFPLSGEMIRVKTLFEILSEAGKRVGVINWWHSWPAQALNGFVVSDRINYGRWREIYGQQQSPERLTFPSSLLPEIKNLILLPREVDLSTYRRFVDISESELEEMRTTTFQHLQLKSELKYLYSMDETVRKIALFSLKHFIDLDLFALYFRGIDIMSHCALQYSEWNRNLAAESEERRKYGNAVTAYYCYMDTVLGELLKEIDSSTSLIIASDHGFVQEKNGKFGHRRSKPPGILILSGGNFKKRQSIKRATIFDLAPTILYLNGLPIARDMKGKVLENYIQDDFLHQHPVTFIKGYGKRKVKDHIPPSPSVDEEIKERLKALGYIDKEL
jgi:predicted AlkP superfamily phosphohydrolase/phosphomutase